VGLVALATLAYWLPGYDRIYNHFVWQAMAFLDGRAAIDWPVPPSDGSLGNAFFQDIFPITDAGGAPTGRALLPFPPLPAVVLLPFAAIWGVATNERAISAVLGAIDVGLCWWMLGRISISRSIRLGATVFFAFGTVFWYAAQIGTTWFFAHVVAVACLVLAMGIALGRDPAADDDIADPVDTRSIGRAIADGMRAPLALLDPPQVLAGFLFGLACAARLTIAFGAPFFMLVGRGPWLRRSVSAGIGAAIPIGALLLYNLASTGHLFSPVYEYLYRLEATGYPGLHYHADWGIEDLRYLPQNLAILLVSSPSILPDQLTSAGLPVRAACEAAGAARGLFDAACPIAIPRDVGMSIILTSPAYLLALPALVGPRSRLVVGALAALVAIAFVNLLHFSQGWVQFGYRFSNDFVAFGVVLVAIGMARRGAVRWIGIALIALSMVVNLWGVIWGNVLGW
jgi:hypothetical protein